MTLDEFVQRYVDYNMDGRGKPSGSHGQHIYRGAIYYIGGRPSMRIIDGPKGATILLKESSGADMTRHHFLSVDCIGVFSKYEGDFISDEETHARVQWMMVCKIKEYVDETIPGWSNEACAMNNARYNVTDSLQRLIDNYDRYRRFFNLPWPGIPASFRERLLRTLDTKAKAWNDPASIIKRERTRAKRLAEKALGLEKTS